MAEPKHATQPDKPKDTEDILQAYMSLEMTGYMLKYKFKAINTIYINTFLATPIQ